MKKQADNAEGNEADAAERKTKMKFTVDKRYLLLPINGKAEKKELILYREDGTPAVDLQLCLDTASGNLFPYDLRECRGQTLECNLDFMPRLSDELPGYQREPHRPLAHFSPRFGWMNDPNGLIYYENRWHAFFQYNPVGIKWGNMHWGHAVSDDLMHWSEEEIALFPDENGYMYSGSAVEDTENLTGLKENVHNPLLLFYTASPNHGVMDAGKVYTQRLAYSVDGGCTFRKYPLAMVENIARANRDPKVIFCEEWNKWLMTLYLEEDEYALLTSDNLLNWRLHQRFRVPGENECPDFFPLTAEGERYWVFIGAHDRYLVGKMDSGIFEPVQEACGLQDGKNYAAQTFSGVPDGRRIRVGWNKSGMENRMCQGAMTTPCCLSLRKAAEGLRLSATPVIEMENICHDEVSGRNEITLTGKAHRILAFLPEKKKTIIAIGGLTVEADTAAGTVSSLGYAGTLSGNMLEIIRDAHSVECWCGDSFLCLPYLAEEGTVSLQCPGGLLRAWRID